MIKAVTFDVGGTLADGGLDKKLFVSKVIEYLSGLGFKVNKKAYKKALDAAMKRLQASWASGREMSFDQFYSLVLSGLGITPDDSLLEDLRSLYFSCFKSEVLPGARGVLEALSGRYKLGVISNSISCWPRKFLEREGLDAYFQVIIISGEVGWRKPHRKIFEAALTGLGLEPEEVVHVGNSPSDDVAGAKAVGMKAVLVLGQDSNEAWEVEPDAVIRSLSELPRVLANMDP
ncbi:hypothetical protein DRO33_02790 [Candidatus Bathyarchaeota archaeon]|nr:MAG: hypothetical protein DRO33_02790 [Candidatus Bathyarchaeota archaeon]